MNTPRRHITNLRSTAFPIPRSRYQGSIEQSTYGPEVISEGAFSSVEEESARDGSSVIRVGRGVGGDPELDPLDTDFIANAITCASSRCDVASNEETRSVRRNVEEYVRLFPLQELPLGRDSPTDLRPYLAPLPLAERRHARRLNGIHNHKTQTTLTLSLKV